MICVTLTIDMPEWWGAETAFAVGGEAGVKELCQEDIFALVEDATWKIEAKECRDALPLL
jgi:hypothetical protein